MHVYEDSINEKCRHWYPVCLSGSSGCGKSRGLPAIGTPFDCRCLKLRYISSQAPLRAWSCPDPILSLELFDGMANLRGMDSDFQRHGTPM